MSLESIKLVDWPFEAFRGFILTLLFLRCAAQPRTPYDSHRRTPRGREPWLPAITRYLLCTFMYYILCRFVISACGFPSIPFFAHMTAAAVGRVIFWDHPLGYTAVSYHETGENSTDRINELMNESINQSISHSANQRSTQPSTNNQQNASRRLLSERRDPLGPPGTPR